MRFLVLIFCFAANVCWASSGKLITFAGISGSGKSTLAKELGHLLDAKVFSETEENDWPEWVREKYPYGEFTAYVTFRALRVNALWQASEWTKEGGMAIVDSYYDKLTSYYLGKKGMEWLIEKEDPYYVVVEQLTKLDTIYLPDADLIVLLDISLEDWKKCLMNRGRIRDSIEGFQESYELYRSYVKKAVETLHRERHIPYVVFQPHFGDPKLEALRLCKELQ